MPKDRTRDAQLSLLPDLLNDPDRRRQRENNQRIEEFVRKLLADTVQQSGSYYRRFLTSD